MWDVLSKRRASGAPRAALGTCLLVISAAQEPIDLLPPAIQRLQEEFQSTRQRVISYLRMATVSASGDVAQGQTTSGLSPRDWKTLRNASQEEMDPAGDGGHGREGDGRTAPEDARCQAGGCTRPSQ